MLDYNYSLNNHLGEKDSPFMAASKEITATIRPLNELTDLGDRWQELQTRSQHSFFNSWPWIESWLQLLPDETSPLVFVALTDNLTVGLAILVPRRTLRHGFIVSNKLLLHETGDLVLDEVTIEHNNLLADTRLEASVAEIFIDTLTSQHGLKWDEVVLGGVLDDAQLLKVCARENPHFMLTQHHSLPAPYIDLAAVRNSGLDYLPQLSKGTRYKVRRSLRDYRKIGPVEIAAASTTGEALSFLQELIRLHEMRWHKRGLKGAFPSEAIIDFHKRLVIACHPENQVELLRISTPETVIGYFYNFLYDGHVYQYCSGFDYSNPRLNPGLLCEYLAIERYLSRGALRYDLLAGDSAHKRRLATHCYQFTWAVLQRKKLRFRAEDALRTAKHFFIPPENHP